MNSGQIEENVKLVVEKFSREEFVFDLLLAYGIPKATITLLKKGKHNLSKKENQVVRKKTLFFQEVSDGDLHETIDSIQKDSQTMRHSPRFIIVTDYTILLAVDTKTGEHLDIAIQDIAKHYDFFLPWAGIEKHKHKSENPADRKAAEKMAKLYDGILAENEITGDSNKTHDLNIFLSRLLFCFFAEDTNIFSQGLFTDSVASHTRADGSDLNVYLEKLFKVLNTKEEDRSDLPEHFRKFPYVNGGLFKDHHWVPTFSAKSHRIIIECGELDWKQINPDIFGSMMQAVTHPGERASLGMHYTSVPNIMKVIEPLFLNDLREAFEKCGGNKRKLDELRIRMSKIKFFDPACGSGNFLIITYKELRRLEMEIIKEIGAFSFSDLQLSQFYGIEIDDFAHEIARLSLYLAEHQMNQEFKHEFGETRPTLPLRESGNIVCGNATRTDWDAVCPKTAGDEVYILGNPPYLGSRNQNQEQKDDMKEVFGSGYKSLDYIACWFMLASEYVCKNFESTLSGSRLLDFTSESELPLDFGDSIVPRVKFSFVSTNSICQGEQVALLWPRVLGDKLEIFFAHQSFKWQNNAKGNAGVTVVIVGVCLVSNAPKKIYREGSYWIVKNVNPYLTAGGFVHIVRRSKPLARNLPKMVYGNLLNDGGNLVLSFEQKENLVLEYPEISLFIKKYIGSKEFLRGEERWCFYIQDSQLKEAQENPEIQKRLENIKKMRSSSTEVSTRKAANSPHRFYFSSHKETNSILVPRTSSENREYIPIGFFSNETIISDAAQAIYDAEPWIFGVISSRMHMIWVRAVAGRLKTDYRYSSALCYNTFPIPPLTTKQKEDITRHVYEVLEEREKHSQKTMAQLYDPDKMPEGLREAHHSLDLAIERLYRSKPFTSDEDRLEYLFALYERMIAEERK